MDFQKKIENIRNISKDQFDVLYKISKELNADFFESSFLPKTLNLIIKVLSAERGLFVRLTDEGVFRVISAVNVENDKTLDLSNFSSGILHQVIELKRPIIYHDVQNIPGLSQFQSVQLHNIKSVIGVPIKREDKIWGIILADSSSNRREFTEQNLKFMDFLSNIISLSLDKIEKIESLHSENLILKNQLENVNKIPELIGESKPMQKLINLIHKVASTDATVLLLGESGTGKELVARAVHNLSRRKNNPYLAQFCGSIPDTLLESELFGYKKGAFTGAFSDKKGLFEVATQGTFFLDEIADISLALQAKMLRVLQNKEIMRLGDTSIIKVDVRVIAATNKDLKQLVKEGNFREDLFYRLNVFPIMIPPLRERKGDIPLLVKHFVNRLDPNKIIHPAALRMLEEYGYPGNVRQLENIIHRAVILAEGSKILPEHVFIEDDKADLFSGTLKEYEKKLLISRLDEFKGNRTLTAQSLGVSVRWVQLKLKEFANHHENELV